MNDLLKKLVTISNLDAAWQRVLANGGCRGSDGVNLQRFGLDLIGNLRDLSHSLEHGYYHPYPLLRSPVPKGRSTVGPLNRSTVAPLDRSTVKLSNGQTVQPSHRFLSVPTVRDRVAQTAAFLATKEIFEAEFEDVSHAYREGRGVKTAVWDIKEWRDKGYRFAVDADITSYFDNVPHGILLGKLEKLIPDPAILRLFEKWIRAEIYDGQKIWTLDKGIPQGSVVSPPLANLLLDELDETLISFKMKLVRYADDFLILTKTEAAAQDAIELTDMMLEDLQLDLNPLKTKIVHFDKGFKFLGAIFLHDGIFLPFPQKRDKEHPPPKLPPPLTLRRYLELKNK
ncbi:MAG: reverse transcriptase domain-containing protein [candidate division KSB1 bacterium]|nr:reverse transcriptase domain-containing protein [candidate division KSB1 bacterium]MDZ7365952.1 reverse transcriptase domain-containing protein [candidate division KSB1 bacterium]MDZ7403815.1 reverse transcriptase domain-containing protein [candidate division KSB1 bacterium]